MRNWSADSFPTKHCGFEVIAAITTSSVRALKRLREIITAGRFLCEYVSVNGKETITTSPCSYRVILRIKRIVPHIPERTLSESRHRRIRGNSLNGRASCYSHTHRLTGIRYHRIDAQHIHIRQYKCYKNGVNDRHPRPSLHPPQICKLIILRPRTLCNKRREFFVL